MEKEKESAPRFGHWREFWLTAGSVIALVAAVFLVTSRFVTPAPPHKMVIAAANKGSPYYRWAEEYQKTLGQSGITLEIRETTGSVENLQLLNDDKSGVQLGFVQGGIASSRDNPQLLSLGRVIYEPLWVFYRGDAKIDRLAELKGKRVLVGPSGSGTYQLAIRLLAANGVSGDSAKLIAMGLPDYVEALESDKADAGFLVLGPEARTVERLLNSPKIRLLSMSQAEAYAQRFPFLSRLELKEGVVDFGRDIPSSDITLVATTAGVLMRDDLHSALANLMTQTLVEVHSKAVIDANGEAAIFGRSAAFPVAADPEFPLADEAGRVYRAGPPFLQRYLPFWLATLFDRTVVLLVPILGLAFPLMRLAPMLYSWRVRRGLVRWYGELKKVEDGVRSDASPEQVAQASADIDRIEASVNEITLPLGFTNQLYDLLQHIEVVRRRLGTLSGQKLPRVEIAGG